MLYVDQKDLPVKPAYNIQNEDNKTYPNFNIFIFNVRWSVL